MIKVNKNNVVQVAAQEWKKEYYDRDGSWYVFPNGRRAKDVYSSLKKAKNADEVALIANWSWVEIKCDVCDHRVDEVIRFPFDGGSFSICLPCLNKAVKL